ncbi:3-isopropylmalate dehydratase large subunit [Spirillospora sp. NPDC047279]|uniref:3-isopropylmalate dehydratase large subunit n=1 Tax=Spirillospora sp. NPDC047279 TaxID=3155478 RepID=UPI00340BD06A
MAPRTLFDKLWDAHVVRSAPGEADLLYIDLHLVQEVSSPQAFDALRDQGRGVRRPDLTLATADHAVPTHGIGLEVADGMTRLQLQALSANCEEFGIPFYGMGSPRQGIVHVIGPELGLTQPGMTIVCGDSHTSTHGAFGALAFGIGTSEIAHVLATQCLPQQRPRTLLVDVSGRLPSGVTPKDLALTLMHELGTSGAAGRAIEYRGDAISSLTMEGRMTVCNMSIEMGGRVGMIAPDDVTYAYLQDRPFIASMDHSFDDLVRLWTELRSDDGAHFDLVHRVDASRVAPMVSWGTTPAMSVPVTGRVPTPETQPDREGARRALDYMGLSGGEAVQDLAVDRVFIGSCTNGRIEDLRAAAAVLRGRRVADGVDAMVVPGSAAVRRQAEEEGLGEIFEAAGLSWRLPGCSMCVGINDDRLGAGERCASTSNRNFEGRQGAGGRTHLVSPAMAAAAAIHGHFVDVREAGVQPVGT